MSEEALRQEMVACGRRMYARGLVVASDGNLSAMLDAGRLLITPSGACKGELEPSDLLIIDRQGGRLAGAGKPSSETRMHLACYDARPDVRAVIHAHPTHAIALSLLPDPPDEAYLPEAAIGLGQVVTVPYATPTTKDAARAVRVPVRSSDALILSRHGSLTVGATLWDAYRKLERLEHSCHVLAVAMGLGRPLEPLPHREVVRLEGIRSRYLGRPLTDPEPGRPLDWPSPFAR